jgi:hypothetical protein
MTRWLVTLEGDAADLDRLVEWPDGDDWKIVRHEERGVVLRPRQGAGSPPVAAASTHGWSEGDCWRMTL